MSKSKKEEKKKEVEQQGTDNPIEENVKTQPTETDPVEELKKQNEELNDKYVRLAAEFDNYRKRTSKEKLELIGTASENVIKDLLPVIDDFERALAELEKREESKADFEGVGLIYNKLLKSLQQKGLNEIEAIGAEFNTDEHEALTNIPVEDDSQKGKVIDVIQKGYRLNGKVIRFARVVVGN